VLSRAAPRPGFQGRGEYLVRYPGLPRSLPLCGEFPLYQGNLEADLKAVSRNRLAEQITGGLSRTEKMPCPSWGLPATRCRVGAVLARREATVCSACYALKGRYTFPKVQDKLEQRYQGRLNPWS
jgi:hypothetical protein